MITDRKHFLEKRESSQRYKTKNGKLIRKIRKVIRAKQKNFLRKVFRLQGLVHLQNLSTPPKAIKFVDYLFPRSTLEELPFKIFYEMRFYKRIRYWHIDKLTNFQTLEFDSKCFVIPLELHLDSLQVLLKELKASISVKEQQLACILQNYYNTITLNIGDYLNPSQSKFSQ